MQHEVKLSTILATRLQPECIMHAVYNFWYAWGVTTPYAQREWG